MIKCDVTGNNADIPKRIWRHNFLLPNRQLESGNEVKQHLIQRPCLKLGDTATPASTGGTWVPVLGDVAAGIPIEAVENIVDYEEIDSSMASTGEFFGLRIKGSSMEPRIRDGDVVIVRRQEDAETSDTAVILVNGDSATVKRIKKEPDGSLWLLPNNPAYDPQHYSPAEIATLPVRIIGKVVELRGKF